jgi:hypothetical protein
MNENAEQRPTRTQLDRIESQLSQVQMQLGLIKKLLIFLVIVSPVGLYCIAALIGGLGTLGAAGLWIAIVLAAGYVLLLCIAKLTGMHKTLRLERTELAKILKEHGPREDGTPV